MSDIPTPPSAADRRALLRQYKETPRPLGVYLARDVASGRIVALRAALDVDGAINRDRFELRQGGHRDAAMQAVWRRGGEDALRFETVELLKPPTEERPYDPREALAEALALWREELGFDGSAR